MGRQAIAFGVPRCFELDLDRHVSEISYILGLVLRLPAIQA